MSFLVLYSVASSQTPALHLQWRYCNKEASSFWWFNPNSGNANKIFTVVSYCVNMNCQRAIANSQFK